ncbi:hypothetical protein [Listeria booriae]|uniref:hypothetical protein n=1 Tax=Listeria booriae TaxID=1552123 RepID=UPI001624CC3A|nr:hypothetical protein [Listeria booriae]MBC1233629.1 hypothetical protein [Listeria booriae]
MSVEFKGMDGILKELENKCGPRKLNQVTTNALKKGSEVVKEDMVQAFGAFADTGASQNEIIVSVPRTIQGVKQVRLGWNGPKARWRMIHLNENGYTKTGRRITPRGFGTIRKTVDSSSKKFSNIVQNELERLL